MPYKSRWRIDIPRCSLPTFLFGSSANLPHVPSNPEKVCLAEAARPDTHFLTRGTYQLWCQRFALGLQQSGLFEAGDRLLLFSPNSIFVPVVFMGTLFAGGIFTGANPSYTAQELAYQLRNSEAALLLCHTSSIETGVQAAKMSGLDLSRVFVFDDSILDGAGTPSHGAGYWSRLVSYDLKKAELFAWPDLTGPEEWNTTLALNYSSGTTGLPKGVEVTHLNYIANTLQTSQTVQNHPDYEKRRLNSASLAYLPLYHAYGQTVYIALYFHQERTAYVMPKFDFIKMLEYSERFKVSDMNLVPPIAVALAKHPDVEKYDLSNVSFLGCGAAPLSREIAEQVENRLNKNRKDEDRLNLRQGWGMTEWVTSAYNDCGGGLIESPDVPALYFTRISMKRLPQIL